MKLSEAVEFAVTHLENEVDRDFDGVTVTQAEQWEYARALPLLKALQIELAREEANIR